MKRTPLALRKLPDYSRRNELANMISHIVGGALGVVVLFAVMVISIQKRSAWILVSGSIYAFSLIALYCVSSVYHGLRPGMAKKVMQVIDHCTIYLLIAGTYTPILLTAVRPLHPFTAWSVFAAEWLLAAIGAVFTAIDHKLYGKFSMSCYIGMGWLVIAALKPVYESIGLTAMLYLLFGGISYTVGAVFYGIGGKKPSVHTVFHILVVIGSILQAMAIILYVL